MLTGELRLHNPSGAARPAWPDGPDARPLLARNLESLLPGQVVEGPKGSFYRVRQALSEFRAVALEQLIRQHDGAANSSRHSHLELGIFASEFPGRSLFLDLETCGFSGAPLFLIGLVRQDRGELVVDQLLARDYTEECAVLQHLWELLPNHQVLVTFNGKSFDWPFMVDRSRYHRLPL